MDCRVCPMDGHMWFKLGGGCGQFVGQIGSFSCESEHDLAVMVSDFLENGSSGTDSRCSSDSEPGLSELALLAEKISVYMYRMDQYEIKLLSIVQSLILSIKKAELHYMKLGPCNSSCIRFSLVKLLRLAGYDAALCVSKWQKSGKIPGGDHEYIDVVNHRDNGTSERLVIDIDFRSHFEIARPVDSYDRILQSLPVVYVGSLPKLKKYLHVMVEAARSSLKQNSMPLPPWRSFAYLQAKWHSPYQRKLYPDAQSLQESASCDHKQCIGHLKSLKTALQSEIESDRLLKPINKDNKKRVTHERRHSSFRDL